MISIRKKILAGFVFLLVLFLIPALFSVRASISVRADARELREGTIRNLNQVNSMLNSLETIRRSLMVAVTELDAQKLRLAEQSAAEFLSRLDSLASRIPAADIQATGDTGRKYIGTAIPAVRDMIEGGQLSGISEKMSEFDGMAEALRMDLEALRQKINDDLMNTLDHVDTESRQSMVLIIALFSVIFMVGTAASFFIASKITAGVSRVLEGMENISRGSGDLTQRIEIESRDEMRQLADTFNSFSEDLRRIMARVRNASQSLSQAVSRVTEASREMEEGSTLQQNRAEDTLSSLERNARSMAQVSESTDELAASTSQMAGSVREVESFIVRISGSAENLLALSEDTADLGAAVADLTAKALEKSGRQEQQIGQTATRIREIVAAVDTITESTEEADRIAMKNADLGGHGGQAVDQAYQASQKMFGVIRSTTEAVQRVARRSAEIDDIIRLIDEIADQTNILALNAAVIAAQAGEHGRGFAVVAQNVRALAARSIEATGNISGIIEQIQGEAEAAVHLAEETVREAAESERLSEAARQSIRQMVSGANQVADLLKKVTSQAREQKMSSTRVVTSLDDLSAVTSQVKAAMGDQSRSADRIRQAASGVRDVAAELKNWTQTVATAAEEMSRAMDGMNQMTEEVAQSSREQSLETEGVTQSMREVGQSARLMREAARGISASMAELAIQGRDMTELVGRFKV